MAGRGRARGNLEKPRPLRKATYTLLKAQCPGGAENGLAEEREMGKLSSAEAKMVQDWIKLVNTDTQDHEDSLAQLCMDLRVKGAKLEDNVPSCLDPVFDAVRGALYKPQLDSQQRALLLELLEIRASGWEPKPRITAYYRRRRRPYKAQMKSSAQVHAHDKPVVVGSKLVKCPKGKKLLSSKNKATCKYLSPGDHSAMEKVELIVAAVKDPVHLMNEDFRYNNERSSEVHSPPDSSLSVSLAPGKGSTWNHAGLNCQRDHEEKKLFKNCNNDEVDPGKMSSRNVGTLRSVYGIKFRGSTFVDSSLVKAEHSCSPNLSVWNFGSDDTTCNLQKGRPSKDGDFDTSCLQAHVQCSIHVKNEESEQFHPSKVKNEKQIKLETDVPKNPSPISSVLDKYQQSKSKDMSKVITNEGLGVYCDTVEQAVDDTNERLRNLVLSKSFEHPLVDDDREFVEELEEDVQEHGKEHMKARGFKYEHQPVDLTIRPCQPVLRMDLERRIRRNHGSHYCSMVIGLNRNEAEIFDNPKVIGFIAMASDTQILRLKAHVGRYLTVGRVRTTLHAATSCFYEEDEDSFVFEIIGSAECLENAVKFMAERLGDSISGVPSPQKKPWQPSVKQHEASPPAQPDKIVKSCPGKGRGRFGKSVVQLGCSTSRPGSATPPDDKETFSSVSSNQQEELPVNQQPATQSKFHQGSLHVKETTLHLKCAVHPVLQEALKALEAYFCSPIEETKPPEEEMNSQCVSQPRRSPRFGYGSKQSSQQNGRSADTVHLSYNSLKSHAASCMALDDQYISSPELMRDCTESEVQHLHSPEMPTEEDWDQSEPVAPFIFGKNQYKVTSTAMNINSKVFNSHPESQLAKQKVKPTNLNSTKVRAGQDAWQMKTILEMDKIEATKKLSKRMPSSFRSTVSVSEESWDEELEERDRIPYSSEQVISNHVPGISNISSTDEDGSKTWNMSEKNNSLCDTSSLYKQCAERHHQSSDIDAMNVSSPSGVTPYIQSSSYNDSSSTCSYLSSRQSYMSTSELPSFAFSESSVSCQGGSPGNEGLMKDLNHDPSCRSPVENKAISIPTQKTLKHRSPEVDLAADSPAKNCTFPHSSAPQKSSSNNVLATGNSSIPYMEDGTLHRLPSDSDDNSIWNDEDDELLERGLADLVDKMTLTGQDLISNQSGTCSASNEQPKPKYSPFQNKKYGVEMISQPVAVPDVCSTMTKPMGTEKVSPVRDSKLQFLRPCVTSDNKFQYSSTPGSQDVSPANNAGKLSPSLSKSWNVSHICNSSITDTSGNSDQLNKAYLQSECEIECHSLRQRSKSVSDQTDNSGSFSRWRHRTNSMSSSPTDDEGSSDSHSSISDEGRRRSRSMTRRDSTGSLHRGWRDRSRSCRRSKSREQGPFRDCMGFLQSELLMREPIGPMTDVQDIHDITDHMPGGPLSAKSRRQLFMHTSRLRSRSLVSNYSTHVVYFFNFLAIFHDQGNDLALNHAGPAPVKTYSRTWLLRCSMSNLSHQVPPNWALMTKIFPSVCRDAKCVKKYFDPGLNSFS